MTRFALVVVVALAAACAGSAAPREGIRTCGVPLSGLRVPPYTAGSDWNRALPRNVRIHPRSRTFVRGLVAGARDERIVLSVRRYTVPVYVAPPNTRRYDVRSTASWADGRILEAVPIPPHARPDPESDGHLAVVDLREACEYDFWRARRVGNRWTAAWGTVLPLRGDGVNRDAGARATGFGLLAGLIFPNELRRGRIAHALAFAYPFTRAGGPVPPALRSDGRSRRPDALPEGARLQLDPALDLDALDLEPHERTIAEALQRYGMILADTGGTLGIYAVHPQSYAKNPYVGLLPPGPYVPLGGIPLERFRVIAF